jgi:hypothetical protein
MEFTGLNCTMEIKNGNIDILKKEELKVWCERLNCKEDDLIDAVLKIGSCPNMVDMYLELNRKKLNND